MKTVGTPSKRFKGYHYFFGVKDDLLDWFKESDFNMGEVDTLDSFKPNDEDLVLVKDGNMYIIKEEHVPTIILKSVDVVVE